MAAEILIFRPFEKKKKPDLKKFRNLRFVNLKLNTRKINIYILYICICILYYESGPAEYNHLLLYYI